MQRAPWCCSSTSGSARMNSRWSPTRSRGARSGGSARVNFLKPPISPIRPLGRLFCLGLAGEEAVAARRDRLVSVALEGGAVVVRHHLHEGMKGGVPVVQQTRCDGRLGTPLMLGDELAHDARVRGLERLEADELGVAALREGAVLVEDVRDAAAHPGGEVAPGAAEDD